MESFNFKLLKQDKNSQARFGIISTPHGEIETPVFMPVGTQGTVKALSSEDLKSLGIKIYLGNAYHLYLRPGHKLIAQAGGIHKFASWDGAILTDSGGFQVFSLNPLAKVTEEGVIFQSHIDGSYHQFTPEKVMEIENDLGADIIMVLDECAPYPCSFEYAQKSTDLTFRWAERCKKEWENLNSKQALFAIVQGSTYPELREKSAQELKELNFPGYAIGGLSVSEPKSSMFETIEIVNNILPEEKPRYLMGVGTPKDIVKAVSLGIDMFDCVLPTRNARNGTVFTKNGKLIIKGAQFIADFSPIEEGCKCLTCQNYTRAYLRHLFQVSELTVLRLATIHSLYFYSNLMKEIREAIREGNFEEWKREFLENFQEEEEGGGRNGLE